MANTIVALATPFGRSGIGVIRLSGAEALPFTQRLSGGPDLKLEPRRIRLTQLHDSESSEVIDEALVTYFKAPHSFTGEDVVEISCHGSPVLLRQVIDICLKLGARMADPGEFTLRALANGRMNLAEAEAVRDLIDAQTTASARQAVRQLRGEFSNTLKPIKDKLLDLIVVLESALEFVEDDIPEFQTESIKKEMAALIVEIAKLAETFKAGKLIREGLRRSVGRPPERRQIKPVQRLAWQRTGNRHRDRRDDTRSDPRNIHRKQHPYLAYRHGRAARNDRHRRKHRRRTLANGNGRCRSCCCAGGWL